jgi:serine phosphatase RsbU (regulator of sigma subunit)
VARLALGPARSGRAALEVELSRHLEPDTAYLGFLRLVAASIGQALDRVDAREVERSFSESLQRSLLSRPPRRPGVEIAVRYKPATRLAQVGGDWYDAFAGPAGGLTLAVGDVTGHDRRAAAGMAQIRSLLRGAAWAEAGAPARSLEALDQAMRGLEVGEFATAVLAELDGHTLRWCNAGHPPPAVLGPDGKARLLWTDPPEPLLGLGAGPRREQTVELEPGSVVVLYTDGLVEHRDVPIDRGLAWLTGALESGRELGAEALCDHLLAQLGASGEDDVALLVLHLDGPTGAEPPAPG